MTRFSNFSLSPILNKSTQYLCLLSKSFGWFTRMHVELEKAALKSKCFEWIVFAFESLLWKKMEKRHRYFFNCLFSDLLPVKIPLFSLILIRRRFSPDEANSKPISMFDLCLPSCLNESFAFHLHVWHEKCNCWMWNYQAETVRALRACFQELILNATEKFTTTP